MEKRQKVARKQLVIWLPEDLREWISRQANLQGFTMTSYLISLVQQDREKRKADENDKQDGE